MQEKEWRKAPQYCNYDVSEDGDVRNNRTGHTLSPWIVSGYPRIKLSHGDNVFKWFRVPRLVCEAWHGPPPSPAHEVRHLDGDPGNNHQRNLAWGTRSENMLDARRHGTLPRRLSDNDIVGIKRLYCDGVTVTVLARTYGVSCGAVTYVLDGISHAAFRTRYDNFVARLREEVTRHARS